jgi:hypothetical protein
VTEEDSPMHWLKYIVLVIANIIFLVGLVFAFMSHWIVTWMLITAIALNIGFYVVFGIIMLIRNKFGSHLEPELKQSNLLEKTQARQYAIEMCKKEYSTLLQVLQEKGSDKVIHIGPDNHRTPMYVLFAKDRYSTKQFSVALRLDNPSQSVVCINTPKDEFMKDVRQLAEANPNEEERITNYYNEVTGQLIKTEKETRTTPVMLQEKIEQEKKIEVG